MARLDASLRKCVSVFRTFPQKERKLVRGQKSLLFPSAAEMVVGGRFSQDSAQLRLTVFADNVKFTVTAMCY